MRSVIRQGDSLLEHGGIVLEGRYLCYGRPLACLGDAVKCNLHGMTRIAQGSDLVQFDDRPVALDGHRCACGCTLVSSMPDTRVAS